MHHILKSLKLVWIDFFMHMIQIKWFFLCLSKFCTFSLNKTKQRWCSEKKQLSLLFLDYYYLAIKAKKDHKTNSFYIYLVFIVLNEETLQERLQAYFLLGFVYKSVSSTNLCSNSTLRAWSPEIKDLHGHFSQQSQ